MHDRFGTVAVQLWTHDAVTLNAEFDKMAAERPMYFSYNGWDGGHDVMGYTP